MVVVSLVTDALQLVCKLILLPFRNSTFKIFCCDLDCLETAGLVELKTGSRSAPTYVVDAAAWTGRVALVVVPCMH
ncbi:hypothetical protein V6N13_104911 [Hibiscus sabdariffa]